MSGNQVSANDFNSRVWSERVFVITQDYEIKGTVFMPKTGKRNRILSDILNGEKKFVAIKSCELKNRLIPNRPIEVHDFIQLNINSIIILRPLTEKDANR